MPSERAEYFRRYFQEVVKKRKPGRPAKEPTTVVHVRVPLSSLRKWKEMAGGTSISKFAREAVDSYIADIEDDTYDRAKKEDAGNDRQPTDGYR